MKGFEFMKKSFIKTTLAIGLGVFSIVGLGVTPIVANAQSNSATTGQSLEENRAISLEEVKQSLQDLIGKAESDTITKEDLEVVNEKLSIATENYLPKVGDGVEDVCNYLEIQKANADMKEFEKYLGTISVEDYQPISEEELNKILE